MYNFQAFSLTRGGVNTIGMVRLRGAISIQLGYN